MKLGFDAKRLFHNHTGLGNYSRTLLTNLLAHYPGQEYFLFDNEPAKSSYYDQFGSSPISTVAGGSIAGALWRSSGIKKAIKKSDVDIYHGLSNELPVNIKSVGIPSVVTIHDLIFHRRPQDFPIIDRYFYHKKTAAACAQADLIIAISEHTKKDIVEVLAVKPEKIRVVYQSCHPAFFSPRNTAQLQQVRSKLNLPAEFILTVGSVEERKNLSQILSAYALLPKDLQIPLVVVGRGKSYLKQMKKKVAELGLQDQIIWLSNIQEVTTLQAIYQLASVFLYMSLYEGFGIPIVEAALSSTPIIASSTTSIPEATGEGALLVDPTSLEELGSALVQVLQDNSLRKKLTLTALERSQKLFSSKITAQQVMKVYQELLP